MASPQIDGILMRLQPVLAEVETIAAQADDMFWASLGAPKGAIPGSAVVFAEAIGYVVCLLAEGSAYELGLEPAEGVVVRTKVFESLLRSSFSKAPSLDPVGDVGRIWNDYRTPPTARGDPVRYVCRKYATAIHERVFRGATAPNVRRSANLALDIALRRVIAQCREALALSGS